MNHATSSGALSSSGSVSAFPGALATVVATADGTNASSIVVRDGGASGTVIAQVDCAAGTKSNSLRLTAPVCYNTSLYVVLSGTGAGAIVHYLPG
jgi:hypothetical protein